MLTVGPKLTDLAVAGSQYTLCILLLWRNFVHSEAALVNDWRYHD